MNKRTFFKRKPGADQVRTGGWMSILLLAANVLFSPWAAIGQENTSLTIDEQKTFQVIEGFGAFNTLSFWQNRSDTAKYRLLADDLGLSMMRFELPPTFCPSKDSSYDLNGRVFGGPDMQHNFKDVRGLQKYGIKKFIASIWSPPAWMKTRNKDHQGPTTSNGGHLRKDAYEAFGAYCAEYCKVFEAQTGIPLFAISLQNEPEFAEPYNSCVYTPDEMRETLRAVGRAFKKEGIHTKIYVPEALPAQHHLMDFFNAINHDPEVSHYASAFAIHNYDKDGMNVGGAGAREWQQYDSAARKVNPSKELWMTETSGHANTWDGAMLLAANIYNALRYGDINAWLWWAIADKASSAKYALIVDGEPTGRYFASKHFYHFIRPGAVRIATECNNEDVLSLGFKESGAYKLVIVLINKGQHPVKVTVPSVSGKEEFFLSTDQVHCAPQPIGNQTAIQLPPYCVATLTWR